MTRLNPASGPSECPRTPAGAGAPDGRAGPPSAQLATSRLADFYRDRRVLVTGHSGLLGRWMVQLLTECGALVFGLARQAAPAPAGGVRSVIADIRDPGAVSAAMSGSQASVVLHLAAQSQVRAGQRRHTYETNVIGTVNVLESAAMLGVRSCVVASSSRDPGQAPTDSECWDPYNASKFAMEQVAQAYRYEALADDPERGVAIARPAVLIGGADRAEGRLVPHVMTALRRGELPALRQAGHYRPWQHAVEAASGMLWLGAWLAAEPGRLASAYNFGLAKPTTAVSAGTLAGRLSAAWHGEPGRAECEQACTEGYWLDFSQAQADLGWIPCWTLGAAVAATVAWHRADTLGPAVAGSVMTEQARQYARDAAAAGAAWALAAD